MKQPRILNALVMPVLLAASAIWPASPAHSIAVLLKGAGGPSVDLSEIQALFIVGEDSTTVHLKGYFDGPLRDFVWLVPVPSSSKLELSHNDIFRRMNERTLPSFYLFPEFWYDEVENTPEFIEGMFGGEWLGYVPDFPELWLEIERNQACFYSGEDVLSPNVDKWPCVSCREVYLTETVEWETQAAIINAQSHSEITDWARERGYLPGAMDTEVVQSYLDEGYSILAVEATSQAYLKHGKRVNRIQPLAFTYAGDRITIPLKSAASAGITKKKLTVWIAAETRAIPDNYLHVHLNKARLNWTDVYGLWRLELPGNYNQVFSDAIAEAGQPAFGTEYAVAVPESVFEEYKRDYNGFEEWFHAHAESDFYSYPFKYEDHYENEWFNYSGFVDDWITYIQEPNAKAHRAIAERSYLTRLTTFFFSDAKTVDPVFLFNPDLGQVNHRRNIGILSYQCSGGEKKHYRNTTMIRISHLWSAWMEVRFFVLGSSIGEPE